MTPALTLKPGQRVRHKFGPTGEIITGNVRRRDQRVLILADTYERLWCAVEFLENVQ